MKPRPTSASPPADPLADGPAEHPRAHELPALEHVVRAIIAHELRTGRRDPDVEDAVQETLRIALGAWPRFRPGAPVRPWVLGIARKVALSTRRRRVRRAGDAPVLDEVLAGEGGGPDEHALRRERSRRVDAALARLPATARRALLLFHAEGQSYAAIARALDVPAGTVATWLSRARTALARALREEDDDVPRS